MLGMAGLLGAKTLVGALGSYQQSKRARMQSQTEQHLQLAEKFRQNTVEYARLTESIKAQARNNEAVAKTNMYNFANLLSNEGVRKLQDSQMRDVVTQNKLHLRTDGLGQKATAAVGAAAAGTVGATVRAVQRNIQKNLDDAITNLSRTRENQRYDFYRQSEVAWTSYKQNMGQLDESTINPAFLPDDPFVINSSGGMRGGFFPHLIASGVNEAIGHQMAVWDLQLSKKADEQANPRFSGGGGSATAYPYR